MLLPAQPGLGTLDSSSQSSLLNQKVVLWSLDKSNVFGDWAGSIRTQSHFPDTCILQEPPILIRAGNSPVWQ